MKIFLMLVFIIMPLQIVYGADSYIGPTWSTAMSGFWNIKKDTQDSIDYRFAPMITTGIGLRWETRFSEYLDANLEVEYLKRGAAIDYGLVTSFKPRYIIEYAGMTPGIKFLFTPKNLYSFSSRLAVPVNIMTKALNETATFARNISGDVRRFEFGILLAVGAQRHMREVDILQIEYFFQLGLSNIFQGMIADNGLGANNYATGLKASYLLSWNSF